MLTQCGGSLAYWLITRLSTAHPRTFYIDLGQALNGWFLDNPELTKAAWVRIYGDCVIASCGLESYYRSLIGARYDVWLHELTNRPQKQAPVDGEGDATADLNLLEVIKARRPGLLGSDISEQAAGALLLQVFQVLRERLARPEDGAVKVNGLGSFEVRTRPAKDATGRSRRVIGFRLK